MTHPLRRHQLPRRPVWLCCMRCDRAFTSPTIVRECWNCHRAAERVYGTTHPACELSAA
jgi:hypothetical protein